MDYNSAFALLEKYGQTHLLAYFEELSPPLREQLLSAIEGIDFSVLEKLEGDKGGRVKLSPADALSLKQIEKEREKLYSVGVKALREGKVAAVLLAGGQGSRLGHDGPKGTFNIGVNKSLSIFGCQFLNLLSLAKDTGVFVHVFIMTSGLNDAATKDFFKANDFFGYPKDKVHFYVQKTAPALSFNYKILLEEKHLPVLAPNGNGGWFVSLEEAGYGKILKDEGIEWLNVYGVDNVLQRICDPVFVGATLTSGAMSSSKVVKKVSPEEKVGVLCKQDGLPAIVEYFEMPESLRSLRGDDGELIYCYGVILNYLFNVQKLKEASKVALPYHLAKKKIACIEKGKKVIPAEPNGYKLETLTVDIVKYMGSCLAFEVEREREFAPVKNATGVDSVESARALLIKNGVEI